jgi:ATP-dependent Lhr-like helicase
MMADDLLAAAFPDAAACAENLAGAIEVPDHPLVRQTLTDCLEEAMDVEGAREVLERLASGALRCVARDTAEPSPLAHEVLNARPYAFLDDAPLEERRTQAVAQRRSLEQSSLAESERARSGGDRARARRGVAAGRDRRRAERRAGDVGLLHPVRGRELAGLLRRALRRESRARRARGLGGRASAWASCARPATRARSSRSRRSCAAGSRRSGRSRRER